MDEHDTKLSLRHTLQKNLSIVISYHVSINVCVCVCLKPNLIAGMHLDERNSRSVSRSTCSWSLRSHQPHSNWISPHHSHRQLSVCHWWVSVNDEQKLIYFIDWLIDPAKHSLCSPRHALLRRCWCSPWPRSRTSQRNHFPSHTHPCAPAASQCPASPDRTVNHKI